MARTDALVLGAGIIGTAIALHLAKRGLAVTLVERAGVGQGTSYGNAGIIEGDTVFPHPFPDVAGLLRIAFKRAGEANYHLRYLAQIAPWLIAYRARSRPHRMIETAHLMRPLFARALAEHEALMAESGAEKLLRKNGWLKLFRSDRSFARNAGEREIAERLGLRWQVLDADGALALEPALAPVFRHALFLDQVASVSNPLALTRAYAERLAALGGIALRGDARTLHRAGGHWRLDTEAGRLDASEVVVALGPWAPDVLEPLGLRLPLAVKRGYHRHFRSAGNAALARPVVDIDNGYCLAPMEQGIRLTTGVEFAARDAPPTPVQLARVTPRARQLLTLGDAVEAVPWMGCRPCFADSRPVIGRAPGLPALWLAYGHGHWGLTLAAVTGRLLAEMMSGVQPFCDLAPFRAERFG